LNKKQHFPTSTHNIANSSAEKLLNIEFSEMFAPLDCWLYEKLFCPALTCGVACTTTISPMRCAGGITNNQSWTFLSSLH
jgi:hypothetical protein